MSLLFWVLLLHILKQSIIIHTNVTIYCKDFCSSLFFFLFILHPSWSFYTDTYIVWLDPLLISFSLMDDVGGTSFESLHILRYISFTLTGTMSCYRILGMHYFFSMIFTWFTIILSASSVIEEKVDVPMIFFPLSVTCTFFLDDCNIFFVSLDSSGIYQAVTHLSCPELAKTF